MPIRIPRLTRRIGPHTPLCRCRVKNPRKYRELLELPQLLVAGDEVGGTSGNGGFKDSVILGVGGHARDGAGDIHWRGGAADQVKEGGDICGGKPSGEVGLGQGAGKLRQNVL